MILRSHPKLRLVPRMTKGEVQMSMTKTMEISRATLEPGTVIVATIGKLLTVGQTFKLRRTLQEIFGDVDVRVGLGVPRLEVFTPVAANDERKG